MDAAAIRAGSPHPAQLEVGPFRVDVTPLVRGWLEDHRLEARLVAAAGGGAVMQDIIVDEELPRSIDEEGSGSVAVVVREVRWLRRTPLEQLEQRGAARRPAFAARARGGVVVAKRWLGCCARRLG